jgi:transposase-like protein
MARQRCSAEQIIHKLREADVELSKGTAVKQVCRQLNITDKTYYRWRREYAGPSRQPTRNVGQKAKTPPRSLGGGP